MATAMTASNSVIQRMRRYFEQNPDEELSIAHITAKFGCKVKTARHAMYRLKEEGLLEGVYVVRCRSKGIAKEAV